MSTTINGTTGIDKIQDGTVVDADVNDVAASKLTGALPAIDGSSLTNLPASGAWSVKSSGSLSGVSSLDITGLSKTVKIIVSLISTSSGGYTGPSVRTSTDNGSSYDSTSTDYAYTMSWVNGIGFNYDQTDDYNRVKCNVQNEGLSWNRGDMEVTLVDPQETVGATAIDIVWQHIRDNLSDNDAIRHGRTSGYRKISTAANACQISFGTACNGTYTILELN